MGELLASILSPHLFITHLHHFICLVLILCFCWKDNRGVIDIATLDFFYIYTNCILSLFFCRYLFSRTYFFCFIFPLFAPMMKIEGDARVKLLSILHRTSHIQCFFSNSHSCVKIFLLD